MSSMLDQIKSTLSGTYEYTKKNPVNSAAIGLVFALVAVGGYFTVDQIIQNHEQIGAFLKHDVVQFLDEYKQGLIGAGIGGLAVGGVVALRSRSGKKETIPVAGATDAYPDYIG